MKSSQSVKTSTQFEEVFCDSHTGASMPHYHALSISVLSQNQPRYNSTEKGHCSHCNGTDGPGMEVTVHSRQ